MRKSHSSCLARILHMSTRERVRVCSCHTIPIHNHRFNESLVMFLRPSKISLPWFLRYKIQWAPIIWIVLRWLSSIYFTRYSSFIDRVPDVYLRRKVILRDVHSDDMPIQLSSSCGHVVCEVSRRISVFFTEVVTCSIALHWCSWLRTIKRRTLKVPCVGSTGSNCIILSCVQVRVETRAPNTTLK